MMPFGFMAMPMIADIIVSVVGSILRIVPCILVITLTTKLFLRLVGCDQNELEEQCKRYCETMKEKCKQHCDMIKEKCACASSKVKECCQKNAPILSIALDVKEKTDSFVVEVDLPGVKKEDIKVEVEDNVISISGERTAETDGDFKSHIIGRHFGSFDKRVKLPESADMNDIMAKYENGVLTLVIHKKPEFVNEKKNIVIE